MCVLRQLSCISGHNQCTTQNSPDPLPKFRSLAIIKQGGWLLGKHASWLNHLVEALSAYGLVWVSDISFLVFLSFRIRRNEHNFVQLFVSQDEYSGRFHLCHHVCSHVSLLSWKITLETDAPLSVCSYSSQSNCLGPEGVQTRDGIRILKNRIYPVFRAR